MLLTEEQQQQLINLSKTMKARLQSATADLATATLTLNMQSQMLENSTKTVNLLVDFIRSHGFEPPVVPDLPALPN